MALREGAPVHLVGNYNADSFGGGGTHNLAIGWDGLSIGRVFRDGRQSPFEILHNGVAIGWASAGSLRAK
jgi:hypothetical protein